MSGGRLLRGTMLVAILAAVAGPGEANDSSSVLGAGGLVLVKTDAVAMQREDLSLSPGQVRIRYEMRNDSNAPVTLRVAFPLPQLPVGTPGGADILDASGQPAAHMIELPSTTRPDFLGFSVSANGQPVEPRVEVRAVLPDGRNIAEGLRAIGGWSLVLHPRLFVNDPSLQGSPEYDIGPDMMRQLRALGAVEGDDSAAWPVWRTFITFDWEQTFKPGVTILEQRYQPVVGRFGFHRDDGKWIGGAVGENRNLDDAYCIDKSMDRALQNMASQTPDGFLQAISLAYVLKTGANWAGPIGTFHLSVDGGDTPADRGAVGMIALCSGLALKQTGPLHLEGSLRNYVPARDLGILFVMRPQR